jgi:uncharacterized membrane protein
MTQLARQRRRSQRSDREREERFQRDDDDDGREERGGDDDAGSKLKDAGGGAISELRGVMSEAAVSVLAPVAKKLVTQAAKTAVERGPELLEDTVLPKLQDAGGMLTDRLGGGDDEDDEDGGGRAGDGTGKGRRMPVQQSVDVAAPLEVVYDQWTQFEDFPKFMHRVERVEQRDEATLVVSEKIWGVRRQWEAEIVEQVPDERIVWRTTSGTQHVGVVTFHELSDRLTRVELNIDVDPSGPIEKIARGGRFIKRAVRADLHRFKAFVEMRDEETGAWRGAIEDGEVVDEPTDERDEEEPEAAYEDDEPEDEEEEEDAEPEAYEDDDERAEDEDEPDEEEDQPARTRRAEGNGKTSTPRKKAASSSRSSSSKSSGTRKSSGSSKSSGTRKSPSSRSTASRSRSSSGGAKSKAKSSGGRSRAKSSSGKR